jgi:ubiquinone/menaquinone biosynthesis C-methylase UbiE
MQNHLPHEPDLKGAVRDRYDAYAPRYDWVLGGLEWLGMRQLRRELLAGARGRVLEVAVGTGRNLEHYPPGCHLHAMDLSPGMIRYARWRAERLGLAVEWFVMDAERLDFPDDSFDTVVSTLSTCTFPDPVAAMREMRRVVRPEGRVLLLEQGFSDRPSVRRWQARRVEKQFQWLCCRWDREPDQQARQAGLVVERQRRTCLGALHLLTLRPDPEPGRGS